jgi:hypothetical protein
MARGHSGVAVWLVACALACGGSQRGAAPGASAGVSTGASGAGASTGAGMSTGASAGTSVGAGMSAGAGASSGFGSGSGVEEIEAAVGASGAQVATPDASLVDLPEAAPPPTDAAYDGPVFHGTARIMVLGSSNETGTCWRAFLWQKLHAAGINNFHFVGSVVTGPDCGVPNYEKACQAMPGTMVASVSAATYHSWFAANPPDIVLQHFGGADVMAGVDPAKVIAAYSVVVQQARLVNPNVIFIVAQHTPQDPTGCATCNPDTIALNALIPPWAAQTTTTPSPVLVVDLFTGLDSSTDFVDRVHLNDMGAEIVADRWLALLAPILQP